jgi:hypothetical protein
MADQVFEFEQVIRKLQTDPDISDVWIEESPVTLDAGGVPMSALRVGIIAKGRDGEERLRLVCDAPYNMSTSDAARDLARRVKELGKEVHGVDSDA